MSPADIAATHPDKPAYIMAETGDTVTFAQLEATANQGAQLFRSLGLQRGDHIAILLENHPRFFQICWAAQRAGIYYTAISWRLQQAEVDYIVNNCEARVFITSHARKEVVEPLVGKMPFVEQCYMLDGTIDGFSSWEDAIAAMSDQSISDQCEGAAMLYSSGTTGYPKGVKRPLPEQAYGEDEGVDLLKVLYGASADSIYLSPAPLYHAAPLAFTMNCIRTGVPVVVMGHFEAEFA
ncbi:MAG: AMP-binding protein, partial [Pseudomonadota bacterium]|nr:AMP-binding protein [Pseudomonadota bacterium]